MSIVAAIKAHLDQSKLHPDIARALSTLAENQERLEGIIGRVIDGAPAAVKEHLLTGITREEQDARAEAQAKAEAESAARAAEAAASEAAVKSEAEFKVAPVAETPPAA